MLHVRWVVAAVGLVALAWAAIAMGTYQAANPPVQPPQFVGKIVCVREKIQPFGQYFPGAPKIFKPPAYYGQKVCFRK